MLLVLDKKYKKSENSPAPVERQRQQIPNLVTIPAFVSVPAQLNITYNIVGHRPQALTFNGPTIKEINFRAEVDLEPLFLQVQQIKERLNILSKYVMDVPSELARHVGNELVGETYLRWDSRVQFYPTITCLFLESEEAFQARRLLNSTTVQRKVQVKLRVLDYEVGAMTDIDADKLEARYRDRVDQIKNLAFHTGELRCTYVNPGNVKCKTTLFARNVSEAQDLLAVLCNYVDQESYPDCLSYTSSLKNKGKKEESSLPTKVSLRKVSLLINKKAKQIVLYHINTDY